MTKETIKVTIDGKEVFSDTGTLLSEIINGDHPCGGHGKCGKCKVIANGNLSSPTKVELKHLTDVELEKGFRLACLTRILGDCEITTSAKEKIQIVVDGDLPAFQINPTFKSYGVAIDIGTTTIVARLYNNSGKLLSSVSCLNPQQKWGADVISRIEAALDGKAKEIAESVRYSLSSVLKDLENKTNVSTYSIDGLVITGNTVMLSLLCGESVLPFSSAPFEAKRLFGEEISAGELGIQCLKQHIPIYLAPCISAFVGADTICAIIATRLCSGDTAMLADIGTNGEIALWHKNELTVCSTAAGPAFEGVGISMGMRGSSGAIDKVNIENGGLVSHTIGNTDPSGICGSGLVDAIACMLEIGALDESGYLEEDKFIVTTPVFLSPKDIRMFQLAKSAIYAGIMTLMRHGNLSAEAVRALYIAGGFGTYLNQDNAVRVGLIPRELKDVTEAVGNAALAGASMLLLSVDKRYEAEALAKKARVLDLASNPRFSDFFFAGMSLEPM